MKEKYSNFHIFYLPHISLSTRLKHTVPKMLTFVISQVPALFSPPFQIQKRSDRKPKFSVCIFSRRR